MPLPLIPVLLGGAALAAGAFGAKKAYDGYQDTKEAQDYYERGNKRHNDALESLKDSQEEADYAFKAYGKLKLGIIKGSAGIPSSLERFMKLARELNIENNKQILSSLRIERDFSFAEIEASFLKLQEALGGLTASGVAGAMAGFGAYGAVGLLGTASTGTAIGSLGGAAATNAILAWFGGGSLATGGLGMAGGTVVLGGVVVAPILAVGGFVFAKIAENKKWDAKAYYKSVCALASSYDSERLLWVEVKESADEKYAQLTKRDSDLVSVMDAIEQTLTKKGNHMSSWSDDERELVQLMENHVQVIKTLIEQPILSENNETTRRILALQEQHKELNEAIKARWSE